MQFIQAKCYENDVRAKFSLELSWFRGMVNTI